MGTVAPYETKWIKERIFSFNHRYGEKKRPRFTKLYYWLCLSELSLDIAEPEILRYQDDLIECLNKPHALRGENDVYIIKNVMERLPHYFPFNCGFDEIKL